jgi:hypothetical protein
LGERASCATSAFRSTLERPIRRRLALAATLLAALGLPGCAASEAPSARLHPHGEAHPHRRHPAHAAREDDTVDARLAEVARVHGGAGPWAVAGYRMGSFALRSLGLERGSFDLEVIHYTPHEVQYACIADGASAATGASVGKLNLTLADAPAPDTRTLYRRRSAEGGGGKAITLRVTRAFATRFLEVPRERLGEAGREAMLLPDGDVFELVP